MTGRARHGLHLVRDGDAPPAEPIGPARPDALPRPFLSLSQQSAELAIGGRLDADTAGRLRIFLSMFTVEGGPQELLLDLSGAVAVDEEGMAPIFEADVAMRQRRASLRLSPVSPSVAQFLDQVRVGRTLPLAGVPEPDSEPEEPDPGDGGPRRCPD
jgi:anti-anti-sigma regulatory factor